MRLRRESLLFGLLAAISLNLAGCGTTGSNEGDVQTASAHGANPAPLPIETSNPDDPYNAFFSDDLLAINSAKNELEYKCYAANGYPQFLEVLPAQKADAFRSMAMTPDFKATFASFAEFPWFLSEDHARAAGFGRGTPARGTYVYASDGSFPQTAEDCATEALAAIGGSAELIQSYVSLGNTLAEAISTAAKQNQHALTQKVYACMAKGKYPVDQDGSNKHPIWNVDFGVPYGTTPPEQWPNLTKGGPVQVVPAFPEGKYVPTKQESDAAAAMYRCSIDSGAHESWETAMTDAKQKALVQNEASLGELGPKIQNLAKSAALAAQSQP